MLLYFAFNQFFPRLQLQFFLSLRRCIDFNTPMAISNNLSVQQEEQINVQKCTDGRAGPHVLCITSRQTATRQRIKVFSPTEKTYRFQHYNGHMLQQIILYNRYRLIYEYEYMDTILCNTYSRAGLTTFVQHRDKRQRVNVLRCCDTLKQEYATGDNFFGLKTLSDRRDSCSVCPALTYSALSTVYISEGLPESTNLCQ